MVSTKTDNTENKDGLTKRQELFVKALCGAARFNGKEAAIIAGYEETTAKQEAYKLLRKRHIQKAIDEEHTRLCRKHESLAERVLQEHATIAFSDISSLMEWGTRTAMEKYGMDQERFDFIRSCVEGNREDQISLDDLEAYRAISRNAESEFLRLYKSNSLPRQLTAAISQVIPTSEGLKIVMHDKQKSLDSIAKMLGLYKGDNEKDRNEYETILERLAKSEKTKK